MKEKKKKNPPALKEKKGSSLVNKLSFPRQKSSSIAISPSDPLLQAYLREVQKYPLLTREEEKELALHYFENKDKESLQRLVTSNLRFVVKIAYEYIHYRLKLLDLIQEGNIGLLKAVQDFDPYKDVRLTTYAVWWIRSYIQDAILRNYSLVKMGTTQAQKKLFYRLRAEQNKLEQQGMVPENKIKLLAQNLEVKEKEVIEMQQRLGGPDFSLNAPVAHDEKKEHLQGLIDPAEPIDEQLGAQEQKEIFSQILKEFAKTLEGREKDIFQNRLISETPMTLLEIGDKYGFTKERARQIEEQIKARLKAYVQERFPDYNLS